MSVKGKRDAESPVATRANGDQTKAKLLDAAELLFADRGYDAVSLRDITTQAGVTLALASYHFGTKENLFTLVVARRADAVGQLRRRSLEAKRAEGRLTVEVILDAFMHPIYEQVQNGDPHWIAYIQLLPRLAENRRWSHLLADHFNETAEVFVEELRIAVPELTEEQLLRGFSFVLHLMLQTLSPGQRVETLSHGQFTSDQFEQTYPLLLRFCVAGFMSLADV